jgi:ferritin-like metal-binding protein YciE
MGIMKVGEGIMEEYKDSPALDAALLAVAQAIAHHEGSRYGTLKTWAGELGMDRAVKLLGATLHEEKKADAALSQLAVTVINYEAEAA